MLVARQDVPNGGSARCYQAIFTPSTAAPVPATTVNQPYIDNIAALEVNVLNCRILRPAPSLCCRAAAKVLPRRNFEQRPAEVSGWPVAPARERQPVWVPGWAAARR
jgi:hypothetical protein